jgi:sigma-B regulation protein RsbU (phosphoserine phosphatase)
VNEPLLDLSAVDSQALLEGLADAVVVADTQNRIVYLNASAERLLRWPRDRLIGQPVVTIIPEHLRARHLEGFARYLATGESTLIGARPIRVPALRADGQEVEVELDLAAHPLPTGEVFVASLRDLSDRLALERERAISRYLLVMREISNRLSSASEATTLEDAANVVLATVGELLEWDMGGLWVVEDDRDELKPLRAWAAPGFTEAAEAMEQESRRMSRGEGLPGRVLETGDPVWIENLGEDDNFPRRPVARRYGLQSCFAFPIMANKRVVAVVEFCSTRRRQAQPELLSTMTSAGTEIGRLIEREQARREAAESRAHLIGLAEALQASLLPPKPPVIPGLELGARYRAAAGEGQVGGDFFDVFPLADGGWAVAVGDVCGRGPRAAALTALARYTVRAAAVGSTRGSDVLRVLNDVVLRELEATDELGEQFVTVAYLVVKPSPEGLSVQLACGGHPSPLVLRHAGPVEEATCRGELVGVFEAWEAEDVDLTLVPGDAIVLYTDGAIEGRGPEGPFGEERLRAVLAGGVGLTAEQLAERLERAVLDYLGHPGQDDLAIVVLRLPAADAGSPAAELRTTEPSATAA